MAVFDESKIISALHPEKAEVGKKYWRSDNLLKLKVQVKTDNTDFIGELVRVAEDPYEYPFQMGDGCDWQFLYPYEEPPKKRMSGMQFVEWVARGNGVWKHVGDKVVHSAVAWDELYLNEETVEGKVIRPWGSKEWLEPTVDIYERDCK